MEAKRLFDDPTQARLYAKCRPELPNGLRNLALEPLPSKSQRRLCVDVGCGSGQCAKRFAKYFDRIIAVDVSEAQLQEAKKNCINEENIEFRIDCESMRTIEDNSADLITVSVAFHWFDADVFYEAVARKLRPGGILFIISYFLPNAENPKLQESLDIIWSLVIKSNQNEKVVTARNGYETAKMPPSRYFSEVAKITKLDGHVSVTKGTVGDAIKCAKTNHAIARLGSDQTEVAFASFVKGVKSTLGLDEKTSTDEISFSLHWSWFGFISKRK